MRAGRSARTSTRCGRTSRRSDRRSRDSKAARASAFLVAGTGAERRHWARVERALAFLETLGVADGAGAATLRPAAEVARELREHDRHEADRLRKIRRELRASVAARGWWAVAGVTVVAGVLSTVLAGPFGAVVAAPVALVGVAAGQQAVTRVRAVLGGPVGSLQHVRAKSQRS